MHFIPKIRRSLRASRRHLLFQILTQGATLALLVCIAAVLFIVTTLTSGGTSAPPAELFGPKNERSMTTKCGCRDFESCKTSIAVGSLKPPEVAREIDGSLSAKEYEMEKRRRAIRIVAMKAWDAYVKHAWGKDELMGTSKKGMDTYGGIGMSIIEALGTLYLMGLTSRYERGRKWVEEMDIGKMRELNVYEMTTRVLGSLMSIYQMTGDKMYLEKAEEVGEMLSGAFSSLSGIPYPMVRNGVGVGKVTSEGMAGGLSMEFRALGFHSLKSEVRKLRCDAERAVEAVVESGPKGLREEIMELVGNETSGGYYGKLIDIWGEAVRMTGYGPRIEGRGFIKERGFYEYLGKAWRQGGGCEERLGSIVEAGMNVLMKASVGETENGDMVVEGQVQQGMCYLVGVLHVVKEGWKERRREQWEEVAEGIATSCVDMYRRFPGGLGGEGAEFKQGVWVTRGGFKLQPDLIEVAMYMLRSGRPEWTEVAWEVFVGIEKECSVEEGYTVLSEKGGNFSKGDRMPSEFLGATLKFLYLMFSEEIFGLDRWVFNRRGHPLLITPGIGAVDPCNHQLESFSVRAVL